MKNILINTTERIMMRNDIKCPYGCQYCFSKWDKFKNSIFSNSKVINYENNIIIYPFCDSEIVFQNYSEILSNVIEYVNQSQRQIIISISTKSDLPHKILSDLELVNEILNKFNGFVKLSISITNKNFQHIEAGTSSYNERINLLKRVNDYNIMSAVTLKPILPFVPLKEYYEIIDETSDFTEKYLIGGLYVDINTDFYNNYIKNKYEVIHRKVNWLNNEIWHYVNSNQTQKLIKEYIEQRGKDYFVSDTSLIESWF